MFKRVFYTLVSIPFVALLILNIYRFTGITLNNDYSHTYFTGNFQNVFTFRSLFSLTESLPYVSFDSFLELFKSIGKVFTSLDSLSDIAKLLLLLPVMPLLPVFALVSVLIDLVLWLFNLLAFVMSGDITVIEYLNLNSYIINVLNFITNI